MVRSTIYMMASLIFIHGCNRGLRTDRFAGPKAFNVHIPYEYNFKGIFIDTYWGKDSVKQQLLWDNHSPTWANEAVIGSNASISKSPDLAYRTSTAEGTAIKGDVYICDRLTVGGLPFTNVIVYKIPGAIDGALGENIISKGVWKIDFERLILTFSSGIDSIEDMQQTLPLSFPPMNRQKRS